MRPRLFLLATLVLALGGCDALSGDSDDVTGTWTGQVTFVADTLLTEPAVRIEYDMEESVELRLIHDDGLVRGTVTRSGSGSKVFRSATGVRDSIDVSGREPVSHNVFGTYLETSGQLRLEVAPRWRDHPVCGTEEVPYSSGLLTFDVSGSRGQSNAYILLRDGGIGSGGDPFTVDIRSDERLAIDRGAEDVPDFPEVINDPGRIFSECQIIPGGDLRPAPEDAPAVRLVD